MHSEYIHNKYAKNAFLVLPSSMVKPRFDGEGMIPYDGTVHEFDGTTQQSAEHNQELNIADMLLPENAVRITRFDLKNNTISMHVVRDVLLGKCAKRPFHQEFTFVVKNTVARINVDAVLYAGTLSCVIITSNDELRRRLSMARKEAARELCRSLNMLIELSVSDEILLGRL